MTNEELISLGLAFIEKHKIQPKAKTWTISSAGCSRDRIYENFGSWKSYLAELQKHTNLDIYVGNTWTKAIIIDKIKKYHDTKGYTPKALDFETSSELPSCASVLNHFKSMEEAVSSAGLIYSKREKIPLKDILQGKNPKYSTHTLRLRLIEENIFEHKCQKCGNIEWQGLPIPLELHHIDGVNNNHLLSNLQLLCPNCHAQTDNYRGKNKK